MYWDFVENILDFCFVVDILLNFITLNKDIDDEIIKSSTKPAKEYVKFWFWIDLASVLPIQILFNTGNYHILLRATRLPMIYKSINFTEFVSFTPRRRRNESFWKAAFRKTKLNPEFYILMKNLFSIFIVCHIFACFWHLLAIKTLGIDNWIYDLNLHDKGIYMHYITSLYWVVQTIITVGYGDIKISTLTERVVAMIAMFIGVIFFSVTIGSLTTILNQVDERSKKYEDKLNTLIKLKHRLKLDSATYENLRKLIKFGVYRQDENYKKFLEFLPDIVASELGYIIYKPLVKGIGFFENAKKEFISTIVPELKTCMFAKNEVVFREGESSKEMYFIKKGKVSYMLAEYPENSFCH